MLVALWLPILLSAVFVFVASALINMLLKFWHTPDYRKLANEDEVRAAIRAGNPVPGQYVVPWCGPGAMKDPAMQEKFAEGPVGFMLLRRNGAPNMGVSLLQWLLFCILVSLVCALIAVHAVPPGADHHLVFHVTALAALMGYAFGSFPNAIWYGFPWKVAFKYIVDGFLYAIITGFTFMWLWPAG
jgi:Flp pilus assembly protein TadB